MAITKTQIKKWNEEFNSLSKPEKRVAIAKDVIKQVKANKYKPERMGYINLDYRLEGSIQANFDKINSCQCCMLGACLLSITKFQNKLNFEDMNYSNEFFEPDSVTTRLLSSVFTVRQRAMLEACFEDGRYNHALSTEDYFLSEKDIQKCLNFYRSYHSSSKRVIAAMENIIKNKGNFIL